MARKISETTLRFNLEDYLRRSKRGEVFFVTAGGEVLAALVPIEMVQMADEHQEVCLRKGDPDVDSE